MPLKQDNEPLLVRMQKKAYLARKILSESTNTSKTINATLTGKRTKITYCTNDRFDSHGQTDSDEFQNYT